MLSTHASAPERPEYSSAEIRTSFSPGHGRGELEGGDSINEGGCCNGGTIHGDDGVTFRPLCRRVWIWLSGRVHKDSLRVASNHVLRKGGLYCIADRTVVPTFASPTWRWCRGLVVGHAITDVIAVIVRDNEVPRCRCCPVDRVPSSVAQGGWHQKGAVIEEQTRLNCDRTILEGLEVGVILVVGSAYSTGFFCNRRCRSRCEGSRTCKGERHPRNSCHGAPSKETEHHCLPLYSPSGPLRYASDITAPPKMRAFPHVLDTPLTRGLRRSGGGLVQESAQNGDLCGTSTRNSYGGAEGTRTPDPLHAMEVRYQLRHSPVGSAQHTRGPLAIVGECGRW